MKFTLFNRVLIGCTILCTIESLAQARSFGVSASSYGRGTKVTTERGGTAYVGPRGVAGETAGGRYGAATERGAAVAGPNGAAARGRYGGAAVTENGAAVAGRYGAAAVGENGAVVAGRAALPSGYIRTVPAGAVTVGYRGYNCLVVGGVYYRPVIYGGETVYVVVD